VASGDELHRPDFQRMAADMQAGELAGVICRDTDSLSREANHLYWAMTTAELAGAEMVFLTLPPDDSLEGQILFTFRAQ
jgi:DNA invertase Pin-like site-specific DNA recombinase